MLLDALRKIDLPRANDLSVIQLYHLTVSYVLISLPMVTRFPVAISLIMLFAVGLKVMAIHRRWQLSKWWVLPIALLFIVMIFTNAKALGFSYISIAVLFVFASLKLLEAREERDAFMLMLINFLLMLGILMTHSGPLAFVYMLVCFFYNIYIQFHIAQPKELTISWRQNARTIIKILLICLPFVIGLFFLFPRLAPLWQQPALAQTKTGLSDEMTPNSLSSLVRDGGLAFRVKFADTIPEKKELYWRGPVLGRFDGKTWHRQNDSQKINTRLKVDPKTMIKYTIYHDGNTGRWVLPLDLPSKQPAQTTLNTHYEMQMPETKQPRAFQLVSYTDYQTPELGKIENRNNRLLPAGIFPKTRALAKEIASKSQTVAGFADNVMAYFRQNAFFYDLAPPVGNSDIDTFLFKNRIGYCEHYASSFVFMMRSQGVPARVVTGYQGGEINAVSQEMEVRQYNAHAWAEVYIEGRGWVRYDPTAAIAPERINTGTPFGVAGNTGLINFSARWEANSPAYQAFAERLRAMQAFWQNWIIDYDSAKQNQLWQKLGLYQWRNLLWVGFIIVLMLVGGVVFGVIHYRQRRYRGDAIWEAMQPFVNGLLKKGIVKPDNQPWQTFIEKSAQLQQTKPAAKAVITIYYQLRYGQSVSEKSDTERLQQAVKKFVSQLQNLDTVAKKRGERTNDSKRQ